MSISIEIGVGVNPQFFNYSKQEKKTIINMGLISYLELQKQSDSFFDIKKIKSNLSKNFLEEKNNIIEDNLKKISDLKNEYEKKIKETEKNITLLKNEYELEIKQKAQNTNILQSNYEQTIREKEQNILFLKNEYEQKLNQINQNTLNLKNDCEQQLKKTENKLVLLKNNYEEELQKSSNKITKLELQIDNHYEHQEYLLKNQENIYKKVFDKQSLEHDSLKKLLENSLKSLNISNSSQKGKIGELKIENLITQNYPNYDIINVSKTPHQGY